jgi:hypothetical protein
VPQVITVPRRQTTAYDTDAQARIAAFEAADGQSLETATKDAINQLVLAIKAASAWDIAAQLLLPCGPRSLAGALVPLKGPAPTNGTGSAGPSQFTSGNYNRKNGLGDASNTAKFLQSNLLSSSVGIYSHALSAYGNIKNTGTGCLIGQYSASGLNVIDLFDYVDVPSYAVGRMFRSGSSSHIPIYNLIVVNSSAATASVIGSRTSESNASIYTDSASSTNTQTIPVYTPTRQFYIFAVNDNGTPNLFSQSVLQFTGIFSQGLSAGQVAALRSAVATYVAAIAAAIE